MVSLNVDENQQTAAQYEVLSIPTMILFKNGQVAKKVIGAMPKKRLVAELEPALRVSGGAHASRHIEWDEERSPEQKKEIAEKLTDLLVEVGKTSEGTRLDPLRRLAQVRMGDRRRNPGLKGSVVG